MVVAMGPVREVAPEKVGDCLGGFGATHCVSRASSFLFGRRTPSGFTDKVSTVDPPTFAPSVLSSWGFLIELVNQLSGRPCPEGRARPQDVGDGARTVKGRFCGSLTLPSALSFAAP